MNYRNEEINEEIIISLIHVALERPLVISTALRLFISVEMVYYMH